MPRSAPTAGLDTDPLWYKDAVIYELRVRSFYDSDGDGVGDFAGLTAKLDYLQSLGVTALWLLPFYPSPLRDDGYDIGDYTAVRADTGTMADFEAFLNEAHRRGLRVITELVVNHTSDQHPWFKRARLAPKGSPERDFYVWSDTAERYPDARIIFTDSEPSNWTWDPVAGQYFWHRFFHHQPDLNFDNPAVHKALLEALDFWLERGVDGLRLDAVPYLYERDGTNCENLPETYVFLEKLRAHVDAKFPGRMLLAEANQWPEDAVAYFGADGQRCQMAFHFPIMPRLYMAVHQGDRFPIVDILAQTPEIPANCQWAIFLRNHDELTLEMVTDEERDAMYRTYAADTRARINVGIRRRLAPLLDNDRRRIELLHGLLCSLPGTPVLYYGDEIGMGDNIYLGDRNGVRTPMQWNADRNAGFSRANPQSLFLPVITDPAYHYETVNVEIQQANPNSFLSWTRQLITLRRRHPAFGRGTMEVLHPRNPAVLAYIRRTDSETLLVVANLSRAVQSVELDLSAERGTVPVELFGRSAFPPVTEVPYPLTLGPHAFYWFALTPAPQTTAPQSMTGDGLPALGVPGEWTSAFHGQVRGQLESILAEYLDDQPWATAGLSGKIDRATILDTLALPTAGPTAYLAIVRLDWPAGRGSATVALPLAFAPAESAEPQMPWPPTGAIARLREGHHGIDGVLHDGMGDPAVAAGVLELVRRHYHLKDGGGELVALTDGPTLPPVTAAPADAAPSVPVVSERGVRVDYGDRFRLHLYGRIEPGIHPDVELRAALSGRFAGLEPSLGRVEYRDEQGGCSVVGLLAPLPPEPVEPLADRFDRFIGSFLNDVSDRPVPTEPTGWQSPPPDEMVALLVEDRAAGSALGTFTALLQLALASVPDDPAFAPERFSTLYQRSLYQAMRNQTATAFARLRDRTATLSPELRQRAEAVSKLEQTATARFSQLAPGAAGALDAGRIRSHGAYGLSAVECDESGRLWLMSAVGDPARPLSERRIKRSPLRDVAGVLVDLLRVGLRRADSAETRTWAVSWARWVGAAVLEPWLAGLQPTGLIPTDSAAFRTLLDAYVLERAIATLDRDAGSTAESTGDLAVALGLIEYLLNSPEASR